MPLSNVLAFRQTNHFSQEEAGAPLSSGRLPLRLALAGAVFAAEICCVAALGHPWVRTYQIGTAPIVFVAALLFFGRTQLRSAREAHVLRVQERVLRFAGLHVAALICMLVLDFELHVAFARRLAVSPVMFAAWCVSLVAMALTLAAAVVRPQMLVEAARRLGVAWAYAATCAVLAVFFRALEYLAWDAPSSWVGERLAGASFLGVQALLGIFRHDVAANPAARILGTETFRIHVAGTCSGVEGLGLVLVLTLGWILYERKQLRVARALWLIPVALVVMWCLNVVRIAALVAIGLAGHPTLAITGFHTEAGWIAFTLVAVAFLLAAGNIAWFRKPVTVIAISGGSTVQAAANEGAVVAYVLPFVAILGTSLLTRAFSTTGFEALYSVRLFAALVVIALCRKHYRAIRWRVGLMAVLAGFAVGVVWVYAARHSDGSAIARGLAGLSAGGRWYWIVTRVVAAVAVVPFAEELAFRGFLARRMVAERFEGVRYAQMGLVSVLASSAAFGAMHGELWILGTVAGIVFAWVARRSDSLGAAIAAHATANLVLAAAVLMQGRYGLW